MYCWMGVETYLNLLIIVFLSLQIRVDSSSYNTTNNKTDKLFLRIRGDAPAKNIQSQVSIRRLRMFPFDVGTYPIFCSGVILSDMKVLTAAHCVYRKRTFVERFRRLPVTRLKKVTKNMFVVAGDFEVSLRYSPVEGNAEQWRRIKQVVAPHDYSYPRRDLSLVFLKRPIVFTKFIYNMPYPIDKSEFEDYVEPLQCFVVGHGGGQMKFKKVSVMSNAECSEKHSKNMKRFICLEEKNLWEEGDDGGLFTCVNTSHKINEAQHIYSGRQIVLGIGCSKTPHGPIYTRVTEYADWLNINKASKGPVNSAVFHIVLIYFIFHVLYFKLF